MPTKEVVPGILETQQFTMRLTHLYLSSIISWLYERLNVTRHKN